MILLSQLITDLQSLLNLHGNDFVFIRDRDKDNKDKYCIFDIENIGKIVRTEQRDTANDFYYLGIGRQLDE